MHHARIVELPKGIHLVRRQAIHIVTLMAQARFAVYRSGKFQFNTHTRFTGIGQADHKPTGHFVVTAELHEGVPRGNISTHRPHSALVIANCAWPSDRIHGPVDDAEMQAALEEYIEVFVKWAKIQ